MNEALGWLVVGAPAPEKGAKTTNLPLNQTALEVLRELPVTTPLVFPGENGQQRTDIKGVWSRIRRAAQLPADFRFHGLRHHFASMLVSSGVDLGIVRDLLTHKHIGTTERYAHFAPDAIKAAAEAGAEEKAFDRELAGTVAAGDEAPEPEPDRAQRAFHTYAESLRALGHFHDPVRLDVLAPALHSQSTRVRRAALEALRDGTVRDEAVLGQVRGMATGDSDPSVRRDALEVYVRYGNPTDVLSLVQSLGRASGPTRDIAVREWLRIEKEMADTPLADKQLKRARR